MKSEIFTLINDKMVPVQRTMVPPLNLGPEDNPAYAHKALCYYRVDTGKYYALINTENGYTYSLPYDYSSDIPPSLMIPIPDSLEG